MAIRFPAQMPAIACAGMLLGAKGKEPPLALTTMHRTGILEMLLTKNSVSKMQVLAM